MIRISPEEILGEAQNIVDADESLTDVDFKRDFFLELSVISRDNNPEVSKRALREVRLLDAAASYCGRAGSQITAAIKEQHELLVEQSRDILYPTKN